MLNYETLDSLKLHVRQMLLTQPLDRPKEVLAFLDRMRPLLQATPQAQINAIIFYGSCLNPGMQQHSSTADFYVVVPSYREFYKQMDGLALFHSALNGCMPPNIYRFGACKFSVISSSDLKRETSLKAHDLYHVGRFSKRIAIAATANSQAESDVVDAACSAIVTASYLALGRVKVPVSLQQAILAALAISYEAEVRVEADDKIKKIFASAEDYYTQVFGLVFRAYAAQWPWISYSADTESFQADVPKSLIRQSHRIIRRSRRRTIGRWPKFLFTVKNWPEYMVSKIARAKGINIELTEKEKRFPLIYGWKYLWMLMKSKALK